MKKSDLKKLISEVVQEIGGSEKSLRSHMSNDELETMIRTMKVTKQPELIVAVLEEVAARIIAEAKWTK